jgi:hypothetical protein
MTIDEEIEVMVRELIENHLTDDDVREACAQVARRARRRLSSMKDVGLLQDEKT